MTSRAVLELVAEGRLERVRADKPRASRMLQSCARHLQTAVERAGADPSGCYSLLYDAARKAVVAHMLVGGLRPANRPGAHAAVVIYAEAELGGLVPGDHLAHLDRMRRARNDMEYEERPVTEAEVRNDAAHARAVVRAVTRKLFPPPTTRAR
jgi:hypothetical protein